MNNLLINNKSAVGWHKHGHFQHSDETKALIGDLCRGRKLSDEHKKKIGFASSKVIRTLEWCERISAALKGKQLSPEHRMKCGLAMRGKVAHNKGIPMSERQRMKVSESCKKVAKHGSDHPMYGRTGILAPMYGRRAARSRFFYQGIWLDSSYEIAYVKRLDELGISWQRCKARMFFEDVQGKFSYTPDFVVDGQLIEIKGWFDKRAKRIYAALKIAGIKVRYLMKEDLIALGCQL